MVVTAIYSYLKWLFIMGNVKRFVLCLVEILSLKDCCVFVWTQTAIHFWNAYFEEAIYNRDVNNSLCCGWIIGGWHERIIKYSICTDVHTGHHGSSAINYLKIENTLLRFSNINMSSPSLPMLPHWLDFFLVVKRALGILLHLWKNEGQTRRFEIFSVCRHKGRCHLPFLCLASPENLARQRDNELRPCKRHMCVCVCVCACDYTHSRQVLYTSLLFGYPFCC